MAQMHDIGQSSDVLRSTSSQGMPVRRSSWHASGMIGNAHPCVCCLVCTPLNESVAVPPYLYVQPPGGVYSTLAVRTLPGLYIHTPMTACTPLDYVVHFLDLAAAVPSPGLSLPLRPRARTKPYGTRSTCCCTPHMCHGTCAWGLSTREGIHGTHASSV